MSDINILDSWDKLVSLFPENYEEIANKHGVMKRNRADKDLLQAIRVLFIHLGLGYSLKNTALMAKLTELGSISSVSLFHRLKKFAPFFKEMCDILISQNYKLSLHEGLRIKLVDATTVSEPGKTGSNYRFHYCYSLPEMICTYTELTACKGVGCGETFKKFPISAKDLFLADAGYCHYAGIKHVVSAGADVCVRVNKQALHFFDLFKSKVNLREWIEHQDLKAFQEAAGMTCFISGSNQNELIRGRICVIKKDDMAIVKAKKQLQRRAQKDSYGGKKVEVSPDTEFLKEYVIIFTTLDESSYSDARICDLYRIRWQVELVFKRFKSLLNLGCLPKTTASSSEAWLYGKLFIALLIERIISKDSSFSPWQDRVRGIDKQYVAYIRFCYACCQTVDFTDSQFEFIGKSLV